MCAIFKIFVRFKIISEPTMLVCAKTIRCRPFRSNPVTILTTSHILPIPTRTHTYRLHRQRTSIRAMSSSLPPSHEHVKVRREYGSWESPITAQVVAGSCKRVNGFAVAGDGRLLWVESRPNEGGYVVCSFHRLRYPH